MSDEQRYRLETLAAHHNVHNFRCGNEELDEYLREDAFTDMAKEVARTFVMIDAIEPATHNIAGYFTLWADTLKIAESYFDAGIRGLLSMLHFLCGGRRLLPLHSRWNWNRPLPNRRDAREPPQNS